MVRLPAAIARAVVSILFAALAACGSGGGGGDPDSGPGNPPPAPPPPPSSGWSEFTASPDTLKVHVSASTGNDANDGLSESAPVRTFARAYQIARNGMPDWILLKKGDVWVGESLTARSGRSASEPFLIGAYGTGARPLVKTGPLQALRGITTAWTHLAVVGLHFYAHTRDPLSPDFAGTGGTAGIEFLGPQSDLLFEDCRVDFYEEGFTLQGWDAAPMSDVRVRRCVIADAYDTGGHSQGIYAHNVDGLLIEECVLDHNGWHSSIAGAEETIFNHNLYIQSTCADVTVRGNVIARASSHGLQLRPGGISENNLFVMNALAMFASSNPSIVRRNVVLDGKDIAGAARGEGIAAFNGPDHLVEDNIVAHKSPGIGQMSAFAVAGGTDSAVSYGITFRRNIAYNWNGPGLRITPTYDSLAVEDNVFQDLAYASRMVEVYNGPLAPGATFSGGRYHSVRAAGSWFSVNNVSMGLASWLALSGETGAAAEIVPFPDPGRTLATYQSALGGVATTEGFLAQARLQSRDFWRPEYTAAAVNDYIRAGFGR